MTPGDGVRRPAAEPGVAALGDRLVAARARKGVDVHRAGRDTRIPARHLDALERGDYAALPGAVYARGFLRSYGTYLGLDPDAVVGEWDRGRGDVRGSRVLAVPRPIATPRPRLTFSRTIIVPALLIAAIAAFGVYLGAQLLRSAQPPGLAVTMPPVAVVSVDDATTSYVLRGRSAPGAAIVVATDGRDQPYRVSAGADGTWTAQVELRRGPNQFDISATDPATGKAAAETLQVLIRVPLPVFASPVPALDQPAAGGTS